MNNIRNMNNSLTMFIWLVTHILWQRSERSRNFTVLVRELLPVVQSGGLTSTSRTQLRNNKNWEIYKKFGQYLELGYIRKNQKKQQNITPA
jgi:hypothetical protein